MIVNIKIKTQILLSWATSNWLRGSIGQKESRSQIPSPKILNPRFQILNPKFCIPNSESQILSPKLRIQNYEAKIRGPTNIGKKKILVKKNVGKKKLDQQKIWQKKKFNSNIFGCKNFCW